MGYQEKDLYIKIQYISYSTDGSLACVSFKVHNIMNLCNEICAYSIAIEIKSTALLKRA